MSGAADDRAQPFANGSERTAKGAAGGEAFGAAGGRRTDRGVERVAHDAADHRLHLKWKSRPRRVRWRGRDVGAPVMSSAAFAGRLHGDHGRVQLRTVPMVTGMMSLTSTVKR
jgi:hypothetical protein